MWGKKKKKIIVTKVEFKEPSSFRLLLGCALAYWLSDIINPAFIAIAVMILLFFPVFFVEFLYPEPEPIPIAKPESVIEETTDINTDNQVESLEDLSDFERIENTKPETQAPQ